MIYAQSDNSYTKTCSKSITYLSTPITLIGNRQMRDAQSDNNYTKAGSILMTQIEHLLTTFLLVTIFVYPELL